jgi:hypothetical protein
MMIIKNTKVTTFNGWSFFFGFLFALVSLLLSIEVEIPVNYLPKVFFLLIIALLRLCRGQQSV